MKPKIDDAPKKTSCRVCGKEIEADCMHCPWCYTPLGIIGAVKNVQEKSKIETALLKALKSNPAFREKVAEFLKEQE